MNDKILIILCANSDIYDYNNHYYNQKDQKDQKDENDEKLADLLICYYGDDNI